MIRKISSINHVIIPWQILIICLFCIVKNVPSQRIEIISQNSRVEISLNCSKSPDLKNCHHELAHMSQPKSPVLPSSTGFPAEMPFQTPTAISQKQTQTPADIPTSTPPVKSNEVDQFVPETEQFPLSVKIEGIRGYTQSYPLDCESRSAVDLAAYFGVKIDELGFQRNLPVSDDPEKGFVGDFMDASGKTPPDSYGVHAPPVAALLRYYGLNAESAKFLTWEDIQRDIISGHPVMVWVVNNKLGEPISYTASSGNTTVVARYEHTALVTGYHSDYVYIQDGGYYYARTINRFLESWSKLQFMAVRIGFPPVIIDLYENTNSRLVR